MTECIVPDETISAYAQGSLPEAERNALEGHLAGCAQCQGQFEWLRALAIESAALPRSMAPSRELWRGIEGRLDSNERPRLLRIRPRTLAAAAIILIMLTAGAVDYWVSRQGAFTPVAQQPRQPIESNAGANDPSAAVAALVERVRTLELSLPPETRALVSTQLAQIDTAIAESREALARHQHDAVIERMLTARYQQRLELLEQVRRLRSS